ncbi:MAG: protein kinase [Polyangiales bacterium]
MGANSERQELEPPKSIETRYEIERTLGQGGAGVVYQVRDRDSGERLALKKLLRMDLESVLRLKHEFRALADLHHPNLIKLYDLGRANDAWFITMEHLKGSDLMTYLSGEADPFTTVRRGPATQNLEPGSLQRMSSAFQQLARGVRALHRAGMLHRDLKPSNVMVANDRVVVLDFGLVREMGELAVTITQEDNIAGTPAYMAPEQVQNTVLSEATDWYAFGVMLYEALSGQLPFDGKIYDLMRHKLERDPKPIDQLAPQLPAALCKLCMDLLQRDPTARPGYDAIIHVLAPLGPELDLHTTRETAVDQLATTRAQALPTLVGRRAELQALEQTFQKTVSGKLVVAHVRGPSGAGKSTLVEQFLEELEQETRRHTTRDVLALRARCYEREAMPFKALDGLLDALVRYLARLDELVASHLLPVHLAELARAFPVLERLPAVKRLVADAAPRGDATRERSRAEHGLRELLRRVATRTALVLWVDDLQWGDLDSVSILKSWLEGSEPLPLLLVLTYRSDENDNPCLALFADQSTPRHAIESEIDLQPLAAEDVETLCRETLGEHASEHTELIARVVSEAQGSPFLARQLLALAKARLAQGEAAPRDLSIRDLVSQVTALLGEQERTLLHVLAVAGRPLSLRLALRAAGIRRDSRAQLHALHGLSLTRMRVVAGQRLLEIYHDRMREAVVASLSESQRVETHRRLLGVLEQSGKADPDWLHVVAIGAGDTVGAAHYGRAAAERAVASLAFERAAELYHDCLSRSADPAERRELWTRLGDTLAACGRGSRAAAAYLEAAEGASPANVLALQRLAATHLVRSGHFQQGEQLVRKILDALAMHVPSSEAGLYAAIGWERLRLQMRGLDFERHRLDEVPPERRQLAAAYATLSIDTQAYDPLRAALFQARGLRMALEQGEPKLVATVLCSAAATRAVSGSRADERYCDELLARAKQLADEVDEPLLLARVRSAEAMCAFLLARGPQVLPLAAAAEQLYRNAQHDSDELPGEYYHRFTGQAANIGALYQLGRYRDANIALTDALNEARATENRTALFHLAMVWSVDDILHDQAERARARLDADRPHLPAGFGPLQLLHMVGVLRVACALEDFAWAEDILAEMWPRFARSMVRDSVLALLAYGAHGRFLLNRHVVQRRSDDPRRLLRSDLRGLHNAPATLSPATYTRLQARLAYITGERTRATTLYRQHIEACVRAEYRDEAERGAWALGRILGGTEGDAMRAPAMQRLAELGVVSPERDLRTHFPELFA